MQYHNGPTIQKPIFLSLVLFWVTVSLGVLNTNFLRMTQSPRFSFLLKPCKNSCLMKRCYEPPQHTEQRLSHWFCLYLCCCLETSPQGKLLHCIVLINSLFWEEVVAEGWRALSSTDIERLNEMRFGLCKLQLMWGIWLIKIHSLWFIPAAPNKTSSPGKCCKHVRYS